MSKMDKNEIDLVISQLNKSNSSSNSNHVSWVAFNPENAYYFKCTQELHANAKYAHKNADKQDWILDSGANVFITSPDDEELIVKTYNRFDTVMTAD